MPERSAFHENRVALCELVTLVFCIAHRFSSIYGTPSLHYLQVNYFTRREWHPDDAPEVATRKRMNQMNSSNLIRQLKLSRATKSVKLQRLMQKRVPDPGQNSQNWQLARAMSQHLKHSPNLAITFYCVCRLKY
jgi:hypothetical protein